MTGRASKLGAEACAQASSEERVTLVGALGRVAGRGGDAPSIWTPRTSRPRTRLPDGETEAQGGVVVPRLHFRVSSSVVGQVPSLGP